MVPRLRYCVALKRCNLHVNVRYYWRGPIKHSNNYCIEALDIGVWYDYGKNYGHVLSMLPSSTMEVCTELTTGLTVSELLLLLLPPRSLATRAVWYTYYSGRMTCASDVPRGPVLRF